MVEEGINVDKLSSSINDDADADDNSAEDEYFCRLEKYGQNYTDLEENEDSIMTIKKDETNTLKENVTDEEYYERIISRSESSSVVSENNLIWQNIARDNCNTMNQSIIGKKLLKRLCHDDVSALLLIKEWLFSNLPLSSKMFGRVSSALVLNKSIFYVDDISNPTIIITFSDTRPLENNLAIEFFGSDNISSETIDTISHLISLELSKNENSLNSSPPGITLSGLDSKFLDILSLALRKINYVLEWSSLCGLFILDVTEQQLENLSLQYPIDESTFEFIELNQSHAFIINDTWAYKSATSYEMTLNMISSFPAIGIKDRITGDLVCWMLTYRDGAIGMLYTLDKYRSKGLARCAVCKLINKWKSVYGTQWGCLPYVFIADHNDVSLSLFASLGYHRYSDQSWYGFKKAIS